MMTNFNQQQRFDEAKKFFDLLYGGITESGNYSYLCRQYHGLQASGKKYPFGIDDSFDVSDEAQRKQMAIKAVELSDRKNHVWHAVNTVSVAPDKKTGRGKKDFVSYQTALVVDIDIANGEAHSADDTKLPVTIDEAVSYLPLKPTMIVDSGFGVHCYYIWAEPIKITDDNRDETECRGKKLIDVVRQSSSKKIDGVADLPRVMRTPGTYNYKLGTDNPPMCHIIDCNGTRYTTAVIDAKLNDLIKPAKSPTISPTINPEVPTATTNTNTNTNTNTTADDPEFERYKARRMLDCIRPADLTYDEWLSVGMALKNVGCDVSDWAKWSRDDNRFVEDECNQKWSGFNRSGYGIGTLYDLAHANGYDAKVVHSDWLQSHPECKRNNGSERTTKQIIKDCPADLIVPSNFEFSRRGIVLADFTGKKQKITPVTKTPIIVAAKYRNPITHALIYNFAVLSDDKWRQVEVDAELLADMRELSKRLSKVGALIVDQKTFLRYLTSLIADNRNITKIAAYDQCGWQDDGNFAYPGLDNVIVRRGGKDLAKVLSARGDKLKWRDMFARVCDTGCVARLVVGASALAPLVKPLQILNPQVHIAGTRSLGKTALCKFATSIFGNPNDGEGLSGNFNATAKSRIERAVTYSGLPTFCDDVSTLNDIETKNLPQEIYSYSAGVQRQGLKKDGSQRDVQSFTGTRLTTGEGKLVADSDNGGIYKRVVDLRLSKLFDEDFSRDVYTCLADNYGCYAIDWLNYIKVNMQNICGDYHRLICDLADLAKDFDQTQVSSIVASVISCQHLRCAIGLQDTIDESAAIKDALTILQMLIPAAEMDDTTRAIDFLKSFLLSHAKFFDTVDLVNSRRPPEQYGFVMEDGAVGFFLDSFKKIIEGEGKFKSANKIRAELADKGLIKHSDGKTSYSGRFNGTNMRVVYFRPGVLREVNLPVAVEHMPAKISTTTTTTTTTTTI